MVWGLYCEWDLGAQQTHFALEAASFRVLYLFTIEYH